MQGECRHSQCHQDAVNLEDDLTRIARQGLAASAEDGRAPSFASSTLASRDAYRALAGLDGPPMPNSSTKWDAWFLSQPPSRYQRAVAASRRGGH
jgi:hypothetical protein